MGSINIAKQFGIYQDLSHTRIYVNLRSIFSCTFETMKEIKRKVMVLANEKKKPQKCYLDSTTRNILGQDDMEHEILEALRQLGGQSSKKRVEDFIFDKFKRELTKDWYQEPVSHGIPRWKHNIAWAKEKLKHQNRIKPPSESGRGIWALTDKGRANQV